MRRKYLQEAKLQPKIKFVVYGIKKDENNYLPQEHENKEKVYQPSQPRQHQMGKAVKTKVKCEETSLSKKVVKNRKVRGKLKSWMTIRTILIYSI